ncbi:MAG: hypothetical protein NT015_19070 [Alphaproteobacteria bacterium]|nr:hypothetical protein [Alphaproteobacteria bacterium]
MAAAPLRFIGAVAWPLTIWTTLSHLDDHAADDYVERTTPIIATAVAFWLCFVALIVFANPAVTAIGGTFDGGEPVVQFVRRVPGSIVGVLWVFTPVVYAIGFWLFASRDEAFPRP